MSVQNPLKFIHGYETLALLPQSCSQPYPHHLQVNVKFQNKQRALFLEEICYTQK
jgi:hypothetical protein